MDFAEITLKDKTLLDSYIKQRNSQISEWTFTNIFAWRNYYKFRYTVIGGLLCLVAVPMKGEPFAMMPLGAMDGDNLNMALNELKAYFLKNGWRPKFKKISKDEAEIFRNYVGSAEDIIYDRDNCDYVYLSSDMVNLRGKKFDGKRNHINRFRKNHTFEYVPLNSSHVDDCVRIMLGWCVEKKCKCQHGEYCERFANMEVLENLDSLDCKGALIRADSSFEAFTVGEMLNSDTAVIHIEKANTKIDGLYTLVNQQFCEKEWKEAEFINREQDLGLEGLRKAKQSYNPIKLVDKYTVVLG